MNEITAIGQEHSVTIKPLHAKGASFCDQLQLSGKEANVTRCLAAIKDFTAKKLKVCHRQVVVSV